MGISLNNPQNFKSEFDIKKNNLDNFLVSYSVLEDSFSLINKHQGMRKGN